METALHLAQIVVSIALIVVILLQTKGSGLGSLFGGSDSGIHKTRRGIEKTLYNATIGLAAAFFLIAIATVMIT